MSWIEHSYEAYCSYHGDKITVWWRECPYCHEPNDEYATKCGVCGRTP